jgi:Predicted integral membrane protein (DUF2275)/Putative zinc-finger
MECKETREKMSEYIENFLSSDDKKRVGEHLRSCGGCKKSLSDLEKTIEYAKNLDQIDPPLWLANKIMVGLREDPKQRRTFINKLFTPFYIRIPVQAIVVVFIASISIYIFLNPHPERNIVKSSSKRDIPQTMIGKSTSPEKPREQFATFKGSTPDELKTNSEVNKEISKQPDIALLKDVIKNNKNRDKNILRESRLKEPIEIDKADFRLVVDVNNIETAGKKTILSILKSDGSIIQVESLETRYSIHAEFASEKVKDLFEKIKLIGEISTKTEAIRTKKGDVLINIVLVKR